MTKRKKQLEKELKQIQKEHSEAFQKALDLKDVNEFMDVVQPSMDRVNEITRELRMLQEPRYRDLPKYGNLIGLEQFIEYVKDGSVMDDDGHGEYANDKQVTGIIVHPSDIEKGAIRRDFPYIMWYNK